MSEEYSKATGAAFRHIWRLRFLLLWICLIGIPAGSLAGCSRSGSVPVLETYPPGTVEEASGEKMEQISSGNGKKQDPADSSGGDQETSSGLKVKEAQEQETAPGQEQPDSGEGAKDLQPAAGGEPDTTRTLTVHVCGAVREEGVYELPSGSRVRDAVEAAGGFTGEADSSYLNLAQELQDAWQIRVPTREEAEALRAGSPPSMLYGAGASASEGSVFGETDGNGASSKPRNTGNGSGQDGTAKVNLNTASKEELMAIPGIGETKAGRILEYREKNGPFEKIEDLMKVPGIKDASFQKLREYVTV